MITKQLIDYVIAQQALGISPDEIKSALKAAGWSEEDSTAVFLAVEKTPVQPDPVPAVPAEPIPVQPEAASLQTAAATPQEPTPITPIINSPVDPITVQKPQSDVVPSEPTTPPIVSEEFKPVLQVQTDAEKVAETISEPEDPQKTADAQKEWLAKNKLGSANQTVMPPGLTSQHGLQERPPISFEQPKKSSNIGKIVLYIGLALGGIGCLGAIAMTIIGAGVMMAVNPSKQFEHAKEVISQNNVITIRSALDRYFATKTFYPYTLSELETEGTMNKVPVDPVTGNAYVYDQKDNGNDYNFCLPEGSKIPACYSKSSDSPKAVQ